MMYHSRGLEIKFFALYMLMAARFLTSVFIPNGF
jgi:hypothetical protein